MKPILLFHSSLRKRMAEYDSHPCYTQACNPFSYLQPVKSMRSGARSSCDRHLEMQAIENFIGKNSFIKLRSTAACADAGNHQTGGGIEMTVKRQNKENLMLVETRHSATNDASVPPKGLSGSTNEITSPAYSVDRTGNDKINQESCLSHSLKGHHRNPLQNIENAIAVAIIVASENDVENAKMKGPKPTPLPTVLDMLLLNEENEKQCSAFTSTFPPAFTPDRSFVEYSKKNKSVWGNLWQSMRLSKKSTSRCPSPAPMDHWNKQNAFNEKFDMSTFTTISLNDDSRPSTPNKTVKHKRSKISIKGFYTKQDVDDSQNELNGCSTNPKIVIDDYDAGIQQNYPTHSHIVTSSAAADQHVLEMSHVNQETTVETIEDESKRPLKWTPQFAVFSGHLGSVQHEGFRQVRDVFTSGRPDGWRKTMKEQKEREAQNPGEKELLYNWNAAQNLLEFIEGQNIDLESETDNEDQESVVEIIPDEPSSPILERLEEIQAIVNQQREALCSERPRSYTNDFQNFSFLLNDDESFVNSTDLDSIHDINEGYQSSQSSYTESKFGDNESVNEIQHCVI